METEHSYDLVMSHPYEIRTYRLTGISEILGSQPANPDVYAAYIASKAPSTEEADAEIDEMRAQAELQELEDKGCSVFTRDPKTGACAIRPYVIKGYFKEMLGNLKTSNGLSAHKAKVDKYMFVRPDTFVDFTRGGELIREADGYLERPLRAETMQGPRTALARSEMIYAGWQLEFSIMLLENPAPKKGGALDWHAIEMALAEGELQGLGQWRNGGNGRFKTRRIK